MGITNNFKEIEQNFTVYGVGK
ncbi:MAG: hypothetical protein ACK41O_19355 [Runella zeae]